MSSMLTHDQMASRVPHLVWRDCAKCNTICNIRTSDGMKEEVHSSAPFRSTVIETWYGVWRVTVAQYKVWHKAVLGPLLYVCCMSVAIADRWSSRPANSMAQASSDWGTQPGMPFFITVCKLVILFVSSLEVMRAVKAWNLLLPRSSEVTGYSASFRVTQKHDSPLLHFTRGALKAFPTTPQLPTHTLFPTYRQFSVVAVLLTMSVSRVCFVVQVGNGHHNHVVGKLLVVQQWIGWWTLFLLLQPKLGAEEGSFLLLLS